ncbi:uncharacterized protein [Clytia hemisphaerica]|uniref:uncharacterized protein n=1 Tax=Clytia hemisphaerica TaxID=252671 RepID=UPI0034D3980F
MNVQHEDYSSMSIEKLEFEFERLDEPFEKDLPKDKLIERLKNFHRKRHLTCWHDGSSISNHGHLQITFNVTYDKALFYTNEEYREKFHKNVNVQAKIKSPKMYLLARCPSSEEQLFYSETRLEDIKSLSFDLEVDGTIVKDVMRFFKGDGPACQTECGQQKGGNYFCWVCPILASRSNDFTHSNNLDYLTLEDRINNVTLTKTSKQAARSKKNNYFSKLNMADLKNELQGRKVPICDAESTKKPTMKELKLKLSEKMCGNHRVPALVFNHPTKPLSDHNLDSYEVLPVEPLHVIKEHIKNLLDEIPEHLDRNAKKHFKDLKKISFNGKEAKRGCDYRESIVSLCQTLPKSFPYIELLETLCEITELLYQYEDKRTVQSILRLHNVGFRHYILLKEQFPQPTKLTPRKFYGQYYHSLIIHAPLQYRIIDGISSNAEEEERSFNDLKSFANHTSNHHADHIIYNSFIRSQAKSQEPKPTNYKENIISKKARNLPPKLDSFFYFEEIQKHERDYQTHLERIADYLLFGNLYWIKTNNGIKFFDITKINSKKLKHHFRSFTIKQEIQYLKECWSNCLKDRDRLIPAFKVIIETKGKLVVLKTLSESIPSSPETRVEPVTSSRSLSSTVLLNEANSPSSSLDLGVPISQSTPLFPPYKKAKYTPSTSISTVKKSSSDSEAPQKPLIPKQKSPKPVSKLQKVDDINFTVKTFVQRPTDRSEYKSKSAKLLQSVFGKMDIINQYDTLRFTMKSKRISSLTKEKFQGICAKLELPLNIVYAFDNTSDKVNALNKLITECIDRHAPVRKIKLTCPSSPWMKDLDVRDLQRQKNELRVNSKNNRNNEQLDQLRNVRNNLKSTIRGAKKKFLKKLLANKSSAETWKVINKLLHPRQKRMDVDPDEINKFFNSTAIRTTGRNAGDLSKSSIEELPEHPDSFHLRPATYDEVSRAIQKLRSDCSTEPDNIPSKFIKPVSQYLTSPLTDIINSCIQSSTFPEEWKISRICPVPKVTDSQSLTDYRPISILPILSKVFERIILQQLTEHIEEKSIYLESQSGFRKLHSTIGVLLKLKDDIKVAMSRSEVTLSVFADFSKAFDTVDYRTLIKQLSNLGFSRKVLYLIRDYLSERKQYAQIDDKSSSKLDVHLKRLKNTASWQQRKVLMESLVLSKLTYGIALLSDATKAQIERLQKVQNAAAGFVLKRYDRTSDVIDLEWLPVAEMVDLTIAKIAHSALHNPSWPSYLKLNRQPDPDRELRNGNLVAHDIEDTSRLTGTFAHEAAKCFNNLPDTAIVGDKCYSTEGEDPSQPTHLTLDYYQGNVQYSKGASQQQEHQNQEETSSYSKSNYEGVKRYVADSIIQDKKPASMKLLHEIYAIGIDSLSYRNKLKARLKDDFGDQICFLSQQNKTLCEIVISTKAAGKATFFSDVF